MALPITPTWQDLIDELKRLFGEDVSGFENEDIYDAIAFGCIMYLTLRQSPYEVEETTYAVGDTYPQLDNSVFIQRSGSRHRVRYYADSDWWQSQLDGLGLWIDGPTPAGFLAGDTVNYYKSGDLFHSSTYSGRFTTTATDTVPYDREAQRIILDYALAYLQLLGPGEIEKLKSLLAKLKNGGD